MTRTIKIVGGAWIAVVVLGVVVLRGGPGSRPSDFGLGQVPLAMVLPTLVVVYLASVLRTMAKDSRAMRLELLTSRHELEAIRLEITRQGVEERSGR